MNLNEAQEKPPSKCICNDSCSFTRFQRT